MTATLWLVTFFAVVDLLVIVVLAFRQIAQNRAGALR